MSKNPHLTFTVVADSNALFPKDPTKLVSGKFMAMWDECAKLATLRFIIPEIVRGERLYRLLCTARASLENAKKNFDNLKAVSDSLMPPLPTIGTLRADIEKRFDDWAKTKAAEIISVPYDKINWPHVVNDAIWRHPPFTPAGEGEDTEKGFRDCLILETLAGLVLLNATEQVVFISGDQLLRDASTARFDSKSFAAYENLESFHSFLVATRTQMQEAEKQLVQKIIQAAPTAFYSANNPQCVYILFNIYRRILSQHSAELTQLQRPLTASSEQKCFFTPASDEKLYIDSTEYEPIISKNKRWGWKTRIRMVRLFERHTPAKQPPQSETDDGLADYLKRWEASLALIDKTLGTHLVVRIAPFDILWTAFPDGVGQFKRLKLSSINALPHSEEAGFSRYKYGFQDKDDAKPAST
jgi:hypothetical protein